MPDPDRPPRFVAVHGHFYQPPRANPWSGVVERQPDAAPYHDWNARIAAECYRRLAYARLGSPAGRIAELANTYAALSFNVGPTLLEWLQVHAPETYGRILEADAAGRARTGRGPALAQAYTHAILPLSSPRDRRTHIRWGLADFRCRFGRPAEGLWLPETAADAPTLADLAAEGVRFAILAPSQAARWRPLDGTPWRPVRESPLDPRRAYRWLARPEDASAPGLDLLFYHEGLSRGVAFEGRAGDAGALAGRAAAEARDGGIVLVCTDGETFGHHQKDAHRALAEFLFRTAPAAGLCVTNAAAYLASHPPQHQVELHPVSSWSCAHGVARWAEDCGCQTGGRPGWNQRWRRPLRRALERLRDECQRIFEEEGARFFPDPWTARDAYAEVLAVPAPDRARAAQDWLAAQAARPLERRERADALALLEMQRHLLLAETSCAWFFADLAGIEALQNLAEAARAIELASRFSSKDLEAVFLGELRHAESNRPEEGNGARLWERRVRPMRRPPELALAAAALRALTGHGTLPAGIHSRRLHSPGAARDTLDGAPALLGEARLEEPCTGETTAWVFVAYGAHPAELRCHVFPQAGEDHLRRVRAALAQARTAGTLERPALAALGGVVYGVHQLPEEDRRAVLDGLAAPGLSRARAALAAGACAAGREGEGPAADGTLALHEQLLDAGVPMPSWFKTMAAAAALEAQARAAEAGDPAALMLAVERARRHGLEVDWDAAAEGLDRALDAALRACAAAPGSEVAARALDLLAARDGLPTPALPERWDPHLAALLAALPGAIQRLEGGGERDAYERAAALLRVAEALGADLADARARLRPWEERLAADPALWP